MVRFLGELQLGFYAIAARIPEMVIANFSLVLTRVIFPTYTKMKDDLEQLTEGFLATTRYTALVTVPAGIGLASVAPELVRVVFGDQWEPAIDLLRVLAILGAVTSLPWSAGDIFKATGRPDISTKLLVVESIYTFALIWGFGLYTREAVWTSGGNLLAMCITVVLRLYLVSRFLNFSPWIFIKVFRGSFLAGSNMFLAVATVRLMMQGQPPLPILIVSVIMGALAYAPVIYLLEYDNLQKARALITKMRSKESPEEQIMRTQEVLITAEQQAVYAYPFTASNYTVENDGWK